MRFEKIRKIIASDVSSAQDLVYATLELCERSSRAAEQLVPIAMERLFTRLQIDRHPLLRKRKHLLHKSEIPVAKHLAALQTATKVVQRLLLDAKTEAEGEVTRLNRLFEDADVRCTALEDELSMLIEGFSPSKKPGKWSSNFESERAEFFNRLRALAREQWPRSKELDDALREKNSIALALKAATEKQSIIRHRLDDLSERIQAANKVSRAAAIERKALKARLEEFAAIRVAAAIREAALAAEKEKEAAALAAEKEKENRRQADALKAVLSVLDNENAVIIEAANKLSAGATVLEVVAYLNARGFDDAVEITHRATLYLRNVLWNP
jgi:hypothetical protein